MARSCPEILLTLPRAATPKNLRMKLTEHHSLKQMNTFGMDVRARYYCEVHDADTLQALFSGGQELPEPWLVLGGGSNVLFTGDFPGTVLRIRLLGRKVVETHPDHVVVEIMAGEDWDELVAWTVDNGWGGLENLSLIPGQAGTSPIQNIGAYGVELRDVFESLTALEKSSGTLHTFSHADCRFGYRDSIFKREARDRSSSCPSGFD
jgi:UDP-N-acetylmuramate dehydrogenase